MKHILFLCSILFCFIHVNAQSFLSADKLWSTMKGPVSGCSSFFCSSYFIKMAGDTVVEGIHYTKVLSSEDQLMKKWITEGFIREDSNKKVFYRETIAKEECLLYNFGCKVGDTLQLYCACRESGFLVDSISTIAIDGIPCKSFYLTYLGLGIKTPEVWIEGIGSTAGILNGGASHCMIGDSEALLCYYEAGIKKYQSPLISNRCYLSPEIINSIDPEKAVSQFKVYPNPVSGELLIHPTQSVDEGFTLKLYSIKGELVKTECLDVGMNTYRLDIRTLKNGIYILHLISASGRYAEEVIIKE